MFYCSPVDYESNNRAIFRVDHACPTLRKKERIDIKSQTSCLVNISLSVLPLQKSLIFLFFSLSGSNLGSLSDLLRPSPQLRGIQILGLHLPARKSLHGRPGPELQQLSGAPGPGGQSECGKVFLFFLSTFCVRLSQLCIWFHLPRELQNSERVKGR